MAAATGRAAMRASCGRRDRRYKGSVRMLAGVRWSASGNASAVGKGGTSGATIFLEGGRVRGSRESHPDELDILIGSRCRLVYAYLIRAERRLSLEWYGQVGSDLGRDIWGSSRP